MQNTTTTTTNHKEVPLDSLYQDIILEHRKDPRNFGSLAHPDVRTEGYNPLCGDRIVIELKFNSAGTEIDEIKFKGEGCSICMASGSMMTEDVEHKQVKDVLSSIENFRLVMQGQKDASLIEGDLASLVGVKNFPVRIKCVLLPWTTLREAVQKKLKTEPAKKLLSSEELKEWLRPVCDPELAMSVVDLGLVYDCTMNENQRAHIKLTLTSPGCPAGDFIIQQLKDRLLENSEIKEVEAELVWDPKWDPKTMATEEVREKLGLW